MKSIKFQIEIAADDIEGVQKALVAKDIQVALAAFIDRHYLRGLEGAKKVQISALAPTSLAASDYADIQVERTAGVDYSQFTRAELMKIARQKGLKPSSFSKKADLAELLKKSED